MSPDELKNSLDAINTPVSPAGMSGLSLAFIGDAVYEVLVRTLVLEQGDARVQTLHQRAIDYVNASFQADAIKKLMPMLTEEELSVYKRGRNAPSAHTPKNKTEAEYHLATGFEALFGYLWFKGKTDRILELFDLIRKRQ